MEHRRLYAKPIYIKDLIVACNKERIYIYIYVLFKYTNQYIDLIDIVCSYASYYNLIFTPIPPIPLGYSFHKPPGLFQFPGKSKARIFSQHWLIADVQQWLRTRLPWWPGWKITTIGITFHQPGITVGIFFVQKNQWRFGCWTKNWGILPPKSSICS